MTKLTGWVRKAASVLSAMVVSTGASAQLTWTTDMGKVTGAKNVVVGVSLYDVTFGDQYVSVPLFVDQAFANLAAHALLEQVFVSSAPLSLDARPSALRGCLDPTGCNAVTIYGVYGFHGDGGNFYASTSIASNFIELVGYHDGILVRNGVSAWSSDLTASVGWSYASWSAVSPVSAVPEPETYAMVLAGLGLFGAVRRRRKAKQA